MYYVDETQIEQRLTSIPDMIQVIETIVQQWDGSLLHAMAQERALHLAIETVTDVGSYLIDGFLMREASSYEDIIEIVSEEQVFPSELTEPLTDLVRLRRSLVQDYYQLERSGLHPLMAQMPSILVQFSRSVREYIERELGPFIANPDRSDS